jgi:hypothetical protein
MKISIADPTASGTDREDADASYTFSNYLTNTSARVIVITPSEEYANYLLTLNQLGGIVLD